jgi:hypothetical protein
MPALEVSRGGVAAIQTDAVREATKEKQRSAGHHEAHDPEAEVGRSGRSGRRRKGGEDSAGGKTNQRNVKGRR